MLNPDFKDMLSCLSEKGVRFIVVGAYALAAHGYPRATGDIDIWLSNTPENAKKVLDALNTFGAPTGKITQLDLQKIDTVIQLGIEPSRIDLLTGIDGVAFDDAFLNKITVEIDGLKIPILGKDDLLKNKMSTNRDKDLSDIAWLRKNLTPDA